MPDSERKIGKYVIASELGRGSMGVVYKGLDPVINRYVAIKTLSLHGPADQAAELAERFKQEAQAAGRLNHPNIVSVYEYGEEGDLAFIAMEYVDGCTLAEQVKCTEPLELRDIYHLMLKVLDALDYAHGKGVIHRDIKPSNIMRTNTGEVKITDLGIARIESSELTVFGTVLGTPGYMSPEQLLGERVDHRSDIFSCGVLFYELLTGERAFHGTNMHSTVYKVVNMELPPASKLCPTAPKAVDAILSKSLAKKPEDRFSSAREFASAIEKYLLNNSLEGATTLAPEDIDDRTIVQRRKPPAADWKTGNNRHRPASLENKPEKHSRTKLTKAVATAAGITTLVAVVVIAVSLLQKSLDSDSPPPPAPSLNTFKDCEACPELVIVPPGRFIQGYPGTERNRMQNEGPQHTVKIEYRLAVGKYEITREQFEQFASDTGYKAKGCWIYNGKWEEHDNRDWRSPGFKQDDSDPVTCVSWKDATAYVKWLSDKTGKEYRLMSSSEWEYVARAGMEMSNNWADDPASSCNFANVADQTAEETYPGWNIYNCKDGFIYTAPVDSFEANDFGVHGMLGNVFEWVEDCWNKRYEGAPDDGSAWVRGSCDQRILRGGSWFSRPEYLRFAYRNRFEPDYRVSTFGFRIARTLENS